MLGVTLVYRQARTTALALLEKVQLRRREEILEMICGARVTASPFIPQFAGTLRMLNIILGSAVVVQPIVKLWQDGQRKLRFAAVWQMRDASWLGICGIPLRIRL